MIWETSPAAAELEERMMEWLREMTGLPSYFEGVIQDSASSATLAAIITATGESHTVHASNKEGLSGAGRLRVYCSAQAHSSVEKGAGVAGIGRENLVRLPVKDDYSIDADALRKAIEQDMSAGLYPLLRGGNTWHNRHHCHRPLAGCGRNMP